MVNGPHCTNCDQRFHGQKLIPADGLGTSGMLFVGDSPWVEEIRNGRNFSGAAGSLYDKWLKWIGLKRDDVTTANSMWCFRSPAIPVRTLAGWKRLDAIASNDLVLSGNGKFVPATVIRNRAEHKRIEYWEIIIQYGREANKSYKFSVTPDHRFRIDGSWVGVGELQLGSSVDALGERCLHCQRVFFRPSWYAVYRPYLGAFCSHQCQSEFAARSSTEIIRAALLESYRTGKRDRYAVTKAANSAVRNLADRGLWGHTHSSEEVSKQRLKAAATRQVLGLSSSIQEKWWIGFGEHSVADLLESLGEEYVAQFAIDGYNYDFLVKSTIIEVDGPASRNVVRKERQKVKDELALSRGYRVVHVPFDDPAQVVSLMENDNCDIPFTKAVVKTVRPFVGTDTGSWTLHVPDGESYVGQGLVNHNCKPPRLGWTDATHKLPEAFAALQNCRPYLDELVAERKPRVIVPMGGVALGRITGLEGIEKLQGYVVDTIYGIPAVPQLHPSFVMQGNQKLSPLVLNALQKAKRIADGTYIPTKFTLMLDPSIDKLRAYLQRFPRDLSEITVDIETPKSGKLDDDKVDESYDIIRAGFCLEPDVGVSFPFEAPYIEVLKDLVARSAIMWEWTNTHFDSDRLRAAGFEIPLAASAMNAFHFWHSDLPKGLARVAPIFVDGPPWKHLSSDKPAEYNALDQVHQHLCLLGIRERLQAEGRWKWFDRHCIQTDPILVEMCKPGILIDPVLQKEFKDELVTERAKSLDKLDQEVPQSVKKVKIWKRQPKNMEGVEEFLGPNFYLAAGKKPGKLIVKGPPGMDKTDGGDIWHERRWRRIEPFNPESHVQVKSLIRALNLPMPRNKREGKDTTGAKHLKVLARKAPVFHTLLGCREQGTMISNFIWTLDAESRVHTHYGFNPSTGRKSSYNINSQQMPRRSDLARKFRRMIVASPGHTFMAFDASAIEAVLVGYYAGSERYIRLAKAGVHGWLASCKLGKPISIDASDLQAQCKEIKKGNSKLYEMCKKIVHLSAYLGTPQRILEECPEHFSTLKEAKDLQGLLFETEPWQDVKAWQRKTIALAHKEHVLKIPFGYWHYFYSVLQYNRISGKWSPGEDAKRAAAFRPQATASAIQTEVLLWLRDNHPWVMPFLRLIIHDEIVLEVPDKQVEIVKLIMLAGMTQPWSQLDGLSIGCEGKLGKNLGEMEVLQ